ncbi:MAG TPA: Gfo/Idh/MocA family oxidoreductase [Chloroflexota bacterium]|nr:Gfo/Idh/MocA family oxidoreductase [Chloroflexota bacterium]
MLTDAELKTADPASKTVRIGIAGLGIATRQFLPAFDQVPQAKLAGVADTRTEELAKWRERFGVETFTDVEDMCKSGAVDAIWIATPNQLHAPHTVMAAENGIHVICEKPMAITLEEASRMIDAVDANGVKYVQGHSKIYENPIQTMRRVIESGRLGAVYHINTMNYNDWVIRPFMEAELRPETGGGLVYRQGPHIMDITRFLGGGMVRSIRANIGQRYANFPYCAGDFAAFLEFEGGATATMTFVGYGYFDITELTWNIGEGGGIHSEDQMFGPKAQPEKPVTAEQKYELPLYALESEMERAKVRPKVQPFFGLTIVSCENGELRQSQNGVFVYTKDGREEVPCQPFTGRIGDLQEFVAAITQDKPGFPDAHWGRATLEALLGIYDSANQHQEVRLNYQTPVRPPARVVAA